MLFFFSLLVPILRCSQWQCFVLFRCLAVFLLLKKPFSVPFLCVEFFAPAASILRFIRVFDQSLYLKKLHHHLNKRVSWYRVMWRVFQTARWFWPVLVIFSNRLNSLCSDGSCVFFLRVVVYVRLVGHNLSPSFSLCLLFSFLCYNQTRRLTKIMPALQYWDNVWSSRLLNYRLFFLKRKLFKHNSEANSSIPSFRTLPVPIFVWINRWANVGFKFAILKTVHTHTHASARFWLKSVFPELGHRVVLWLYVPICTVFFSTVLFDFVCHVFNSLKDSYTMPGTDNKVVWFVISLML